MKTHTMIRYFLTVANLAAALALLPPHARSEDKPPSRPNKPTASAESKPSGYDLEIVEGEFVLKGKKVAPTLGNVVDALRDRYPKANFVLAPGLADLYIADLKLRSRNSLGEELKAISVASGGSYGDGKFEFFSPDHLGSGVPPQIDPTTGLPVTTTAVEINSGLFILRAPASNPETMRTVEAFNIGPYLQWLREKQDPKEAQARREDEVTAHLHELEKIVMQTLVTLKGNSSREEPSFQFHRGANLLIVTGTRDAVDVARKVVNALPGQAGLSSSVGGGVETIDPITGLPILRGGGGGGGASGMSPEDRRRFAERYGLRPPVPSPVPRVAPAPVPPK